MSKIDSAALHNDTLNLLYIASDPVNDTIVLITISEVEDSAICD